MASTDKPMKLYATPLSHFSRKVRLLLDLYSVPYEFVDIGNVIQTETKIFADNPLMKVPILVDGDDWIIESDHIAAHLVRKLDPQDRFQVMTQNLFDLNARAVMNGAMTEEVKLILARRMSVPTQQYDFFSKALKAIDGALQWLETHASKFDVTSPKYRDLHLLCLWQHLEYYELVPLRYEGLRSVVERIASQPLIQPTAPWIVKPK